MKKNYLQFGKFALVGISNTLLDWLIFLLLTNLVPFFKEAQNEVFAKAISFFIAVINSFILNSIWTFREEFKKGIFDSGKSKTLTKSFFFARFLIVSLVGLLINTGIYLFGRKIGSAIFEPKIFIQLFALFLATLFALVWNFIANKYWTYNAIKNRVFYGFIVALILVASFSLCVGSAYNDSATIDEGVHLGAGYTYLERGDFRYDPEHPPLLKEFAALPLLFFNLNLPIQTERLWQESSNFYYDCWVQAREFGNSLIYSTGNNPEQILFAARLPMILLYLLLSLFTFFWARKLYGNVAGFIALILTALCPNLMAHARLINTDLGFTLFFLLSIYFYGQCLKNPKAKTAILPGIFLGLALASKYPSVALIPIFIILALIRISQTKNYKIIFLTLLSFLIVYLVIFASYQFSILRPPLVPDVANAIAAANEDVNILSPFLHSATLAKSVHLLFPAYYFKGLVQVFTHVAGGHFAYLLGEHSNKGWWYYFPVAFLVKTPLSVLILFVAAIFSFKKFRAPDHFDEILIILPPVIFFLIAMTSKANLGLRHILPIYPFLYIFISRLGVYFKDKSIWPKLLIILALFWFAVANFIIFPNYLAYFNEAVGGPKNGPRYLVDSNIDWGQDVKRLSLYLKENKIDKIYLDYFWGKEALPYYNINYEPFGPADFDKTGYLVISVTALQLDGYEWLRAKEPIERIGYSTYIYYLPEK